jgi:putative Ca2+/H+ antiporter (TMEM165/GDT1 family)
MKTLKIINNRLNWLSAGFFLAMAFIAWLEDDKDKSTEEIKILTDNEKASSLDEMVKYYQNKEKTNA